MPLQLRSYESSVSRPVTQSFFPSPFFSLFPPFFFLFFFTSHPLWRCERRMGARRDHEEHEDMTMKSTKMTGGTDRGRARLTFVAGLTFSNDGIRGVNQEHEMSVRIEMIFASDHNGYLDFFPSTIYGRSQSRGGSQGGNISLVILCNSSNLNVKIFEIF